jgi:IS1 family transposase
MRQIGGFKAAYSNGSAELQEVVNRAPAAKDYHSDGWSGYKGVFYCGEHHAHLNKSETYTVEGTNADLRHYIPGLARRNRCFYRSLDTLRAVLAVFVRAFNKFALEKHKVRVPVIHKPASKSRLHKWRQPPFSLIDFISA